MKKMHVFAAVFFAAAMLALLACQPQEQKIEYVKYINEQAVPRISAEEAKKEYDAGHAIFVDTRGQAALEQDGLPGAVVITSADAEATYDKLPKGKKIILYCS
jgi:hypothetical protein